MLVRIFLFSLWATLCWGKVVSLDMCADQWVLCTYNKEQIGAVTFLSQKLQETSAKKIATHNGTTEEILALQPTLLIADFLPSFNQRQHWNRHKIPLKILPKIFQLSDLRARFPQARPLVFPSLGKGRLVFILTQNLHSPGKATLWNEVLEKLGFVNGMARLGREGWGYVSAEQILFLNPALLIVFGTRTTFPPSLQSFPIKHIEERDYLCPSPEGLQRIIESLR